MSSTELTKLYLERLKRFDPLLKCVVTFTEDLALKQAAKADQEIAAGPYRGPLHGIPWGAKDLIAYPGYPTTWGATPFKDRVIDAEGDRGGPARGGRGRAGRPSCRWAHWPWATSGSAAGRAARGTLGPGRAGRRPVRPRRSRPAWSALRSAARRLAASSRPAGPAVRPGLRPTFGRVSRHGCMTLAWSMDKLGPIARSVEDCALVFDAIHGADGLDTAAVDQPFVWPPRRAPRSAQGRLHRGAQPAHR